MGYVATATVLAEEVEEHLGMVAVANLADSDEVDHAIPVTGGCCDRGSEEVVVRSIAAAAEVRMAAIVGEQVRRNSFAEAADKAVEIPWVWEAADKEKVHMANVAGVAVVDVVVACVYYALTRSDYPENEAVRRCQHCYIPLVVSEPVRYCAPCCERIAPVVPLMVRRDGMARTDPA